MKYKCIKDFFRDDIKIMSEGDIVAIGTGNLYNITTGVDYNITTCTGLMSHVINVTDESVFKKYKSLEEQFKEITDSMLETFIKKNHDYGNSFEQSLIEEGLAAARIRMGDKWSRFKNLSKGVNNKVKDESIADTLLDLANYAIMTYMYINGRGKA